MKWWSCECSLGGWGGGIAVGWAVESEQPAQRRRLVLGAKQLARLQFWDQGVDDAGQIVREGAGSQAIAGDAGGLPIREQIGEFGRPIR